MSLEVADAAELHVASLDTTELHPAFLQNLVGNFLHYPNFLNDELEVEPDFAPPPNSL